MTANVAPRKFLNAEQDEAVRLPAMHGRAATWHVFDGGSVDAVNAAIAAARPLLIRGEPGVGKSQLARAVAFKLGRAFVTTVVDAHTESQDLRYRFDAIRRLAKAQTAGVEQSARRSDRATALDRRDDLNEALAEKHFITPGPLWWAFQWGTARHRADEAGAAVPWHPTIDAETKWDPKPGCVVLIDEIDKADPSVPNGLLEAFGDARFDVPGIKESVCLEEAEQGHPLIIVTTNEERRLPNAFVRRCFVLQIDPPKDIVTWLAKRGAKHCPDVSDSVRLGAAKLLAQDRAFAKDNGLYAPGQAEYLDLVRAIGGLTGDPDEQSSYLERLRAYAYRKHPAAWPAVVPAAKGDAGQ